MTMLPLNRRRFLMAGAALGASPLLMRVSPAAAASLTAGFIYVGPRDDFGYNQSHAEGAAAIKDMAGLTITEEENVAESDAVVKTMESMIQLDGASLLFPTSFGYYKPFVVDTAKQYPDVEFRHCGGLWTPKDPKNAGSYFGYIGTAQYICGIVAGHMTKSKRLGFVAAKPIPQVLMNINAYTLGARSVDPSIKTQVIFTGDWAMPVKEAEAVNALVDQGADVLTCHVDSPKVFVQTATGRGAFVSGYHTSQAPLAPQKYLTGAEWHWATVYKMFAEKALAGQPLPNFVRGGLAEDFVKISPYGPAVTEAARKQADAVKAEVMKGGYAVIKGPLKDNKGNTVVAAGKAYPETAIELETMDYLVEGVIGSTS
ncbi:BMP family ABC transporter substrate-binding protein [Jiella sp. MQZ9-1]|uniref:BMP family ABC transporter substrate-binding protein n=1 Tax=Jiella flava TaxID=2816857 RepID=A0A939FX48_9HYPH|nr:BMP family ABC transporter substrate-binding protein [Jiella flava]MBO0660989.1 BMP family ABC transporter substrate-binding protein [Jiella flava]MCD2469637.1 BMP family ABC transporter substrate-binding protein [Jiella flava]